MCFMKGLRVKGTYTTYTYGRKLNVFVISIEYKYMIKFNING